MLRFIIHRTIMMVPIVLIISIISFIILEAPPGDFVTTRVAQLEAAGEIIGPEAIEALQVRYGVNQPIYVKYLKWLRNLLRGDLGMSMYWNQPVSTLIKERLPWSILISSVGFLFIYAIGIPIGVFSASHQYSIRDYVFTFIGFIGLAVPNFLFALVLLWIYFTYTGGVAVGLFSSQFLMAPWSFAKFIDLLKHLWMPGLIVGTAGTCSLIRIMRANLLDELQKPYVMVARAKGLTERKVLYKYPVRIAVNPVISTIGWTLPKLVDGELLTSLVLGLPTLAPVFLGALLNQDMYLAGSIIFILSVLTVIGTLISDILLAWVDPRIRKSV